MSGHSVSAWMSQRCEAGDIHTDHGLWIIGPRCAESEFTQVVFALLAEGVESGFRRLYSSVCCDHKWEEANTIVNMIWRGSRDWIVRYVWFDALFRDASGVHKVGDAPLIAKSTAGPQRHSRTRLSGASSPSIRSSQASLDVLCLVVQLNISSSCSRDSLN